jgi:uncharacterized repeat protein (TIGR01451 family)
MNVRKRLPLVLGILMVTVAPLRADAATSSADLSLTMIATPMGAQVGDILTFTLTAHNAGPDDATGAIVSDFLNVSPSQFSNTCGATRIGNAVTWNIGGLPANATVTCDLSLRVTDPGSVTNLAYITSSVPDPVGGNNQATVTIAGTPAGVPTLGGAGLAALVGALAIGGFLMIRKT